MIQVHDSLTWIIPLEQDVQEVVDWIANIDYNKYFNANLTVAFPMDFAAGPNLAALNPIEVSK